MLFLGFRTRIGIAGLLCYVCNTVETVIQCRQANDRGPRRQHGARRQTWDGTGRSTGSSWSRSSPGSSTNLSRGRAAAVRAPDRERLPREPAHGRARLSRARANTPRRGAASASSSRKACASCCCEREQKRFLRDEWPLIRERIKALDLDAKDLLEVGEAMRRGLFRVARCGLLVPAQQR